MLSVATFQLTQCSSPLRRSLVLPRRSPIQISPISPDMFFLSEAHKAWYSLFVRLCRTLQIPEGDQDALTVITYTGLSLSIATEILTIVAFVLYTWVYICTVHVRTPHQTAWVHVSTKQEQGQSNPYLTLTFQIVHFKTLQPVDWIGWLLLGLTMFILELPSTSILPSSNVSTTLDSFFCCILWNAPLPLLTDTYISVKGRWRQIGSFAC